MKKLLAILTALTMAAIMTMVVFAADSGSFTLSGDGSWWVQKDFTELTGESIEGHQSVTFTSSSDALLIMAYNSKSTGEWTQSSEGSSTVTVDLSDVDGTLFVILNNGEGDFVVEWAFVDDAAVDDVAAAEDTAAEEEAPAATETETPAATTQTETSPNTGIAFAVIPAIAALAALGVSKKR